jgi:hypothetical protein
MPAMPMTTLKPQSDPKSGSTPIPGDTEGENKPPPKATTKPPEPTKPHLEEGVELDWWFPPTTDRNDIS